jgi:hypothetical protein
MTATYANAKFEKDGCQVTVYVTPDYKFNYTRGTLKTIPAPVMEQDRVTPSDGTYGRQDKVQTIDLGIGPERRLTINGFLINSSDENDIYDGEALVSAMDKMYALTLMIMNGGNCTLTFESGSFVLTKNGGTPLFQTVYVDKFEFAKLPNDAIVSSGVSSLPTDVAEYSCVISVIDSTEYGV